MLVVSIIGMMVALATPSFMAMQYRSKRIEVVTITDGIFTSQMEYNIRWDAYVDAPEYWPREDLTKFKVAWAEGSEMEAKLGYRSNGFVSGKYKTETQSEQEFTVTGEIDVDGDGENAIYKIVWNEQAELPKEQGWMTATTVY